MKNVCAASPARWRLLTRRRAAHPLSPLLFIVLFFVHCMYVFLLHPRARAVLTASQHRLYPLYLCHVSRDPAHARCGHVARTLTSRAHAHLPERVHLGFNALNSHTSPRNSTRRAELDVLHSARARVREYKMIRNVPPRARHSISPVYRVMQHAVAHNCDTFARVCVMFCACTLIHVVQYGIRTRAACAQCTARLICTPAMPYAAGLLIATPPWLPSRLLLSRLPLYHRTLTTSCRATLRTRGVKLAARSVCRSACPRVRVTSPPWRTTRSCTRRASPSQNSFGRAWHVKISHGSATLQKCMLCTPSRGES